MALYMSYITHSREKKKISKEQNKLRNSPAPGNKMEAHTARKKKTHYNYLSATKI